MIGDALRDMSQIGVYLASSWPPHPLFRLSRIFPKVVDLLPLRNLDGAAIDQWMVIGQAAAVYINRCYLTKDGRFHTGAARPILRAG